MKRKSLWGLLIALAATFICSTVAFAQDTSYHIYVSRTDQKVAVYETTTGTEVLTQAFVCSTGSATPVGTFRTSDQYRWRLLFGDVYGQYATRITGHILFHSVPYLEQSQDTLEWEEYNKLGTAASAGCIRLTAADAKWIYDNCPKGTLVTITDAHLDLGDFDISYPPVIHADDVYRGWDPTDPDPKNPWSVMQSAKNDTLQSVTVQQGSITRQHKFLLHNGKYFTTWEEMWSLLDLSDSKAYLKTQENGSITVAYSFNPARRQSQYQPALLPDGAYLITFSNATFSEKVETVVQNGVHYYDLAVLSRLLSIPLNQQTQTRFLLDEL